jgi:hypothetical protein
MKTVLAIVGLFFWVIPIKATDERIWVDAKINGNPVRFAFDTGTGASLVLFSTAAQRLGLKVTPPDRRPDPGRVAVGMTELCNVSIGEDEFQTSVREIEVPPYLKEKGDVIGDGVLGWPACNNILLLDFVSHKITFKEKVPRESFAWMKFSIPTNENTLTLELSTNQNIKSILALDSGLSYGVMLNPKKWNEWKLAHTNQPTTFEYFNSPSLGLVVAEESWADKISLGSITLTDVPVMEASSTEAALFSTPQTEYEATLGFAALKRLSITIDAKKKFAYLKPKKTPSLPYSHNRLGAVFVPNDLQSNEYIAHVAADSPAYEAGIRNGDILVDFDSNGTFEQPAGTKINFTLKHGGKIFKTTAVLRNIVPPDFTKS